MRKYALTLLAGVAVGLAAVQAASAADLPRKAPAYVPPAPPPPLPGPVSTAVFMPAGAGATLPLNVTFSCDNRPSFTQPEW